MSEVGFGDVIEFPIGSNRLALVVDINPEGCTPHPSIVIAWKQGNIVKEGIVQTCMVRKLLRRK